MYLYFQARMTRQSEFTTQLENHPNVMHMSNLLKMPSSKFLPDYVQKWINGNHANKTVTELERYIVADQNSDFCKLN